jgi:phasin
MPNEKPPAKPPTKKNKKGIVQADAESRSTRKTASKKSAEKPRQVIESSQTVELVATEAPITKSMEKSATTKMKVPDAVRELAETTVGQAERAFDAFLSAAHKSVAMIPSPATEMSKKTLALTEQNMKVAFDHARKLLHAKDMQEVVQIQSEFFKSLLPKSK